MSRDLRRRRVLVMRPKTRRPRPFETIPLPRNSTATTFLIMAIALAAFPGAGAWALAGNGGWEDLAAIAEGVPLPPPAGNRFPRGEFDHAADAGGWGNPQGVGSFFHAPLVDVDDCTFSGAAVETASDEFAGTSFSTVICGGAIAGGEEYELGYRALFPAQPGAGTFEMKVAWFPGPDCTSLYILLSTVPAVASSPAGVWRAASILATPPVNAVSFAVAVFLHKSTVDPLQVQLDGLFVRPVREIFSEGFEVREDCRWSAAVP
jgi:hypothetical protein